MKCPLTFVGKTAIYEAGKESINDCLKEECAWWCTKHGNCVILGYEAAWDKLAETLKNINSKIPLGGVR